MPLNRLPSDGFCCAVNIINFKYTQLINSRCVIIHIYSFSKLILILFQHNRRNGLSLKNFYTLFLAASPLTCIKDHPRKGEKLTLSPSGTLAAITDSLGRILLLDTQARVVVRLWKVRSTSYWCLIFLTGLFAFYIVHFRDTGMPVVYSWKCSLIKTLHHQVQITMELWKVTIASAWPFMLPGKE